MNTARPAFPFITAAAVLSLMAAACAGPQAPAAGGPSAVSGSQGIRGTLTVAGEPLRGAYVYAYRSNATNLLGPADFASEPSAADGTYTIELVRGDYYVVARKRVSGDNTGPLVAGDLTSVHSSSPVSVTDDRYLVVDLEVAEMRDPMFFQAFSREVTGTGIRGKIVGGDGRPVPWVFAMAYGNSDMKRIPEYTSTMTAADGAFVIYLPGGGRYWLAARKNIREKPMEGEPYGLYDGTADHSLEVPGGTFIEGIVIVLQDYHKGIQD